MGEIIMTIRNMDAYTHAVMDLSPLNGCCTNPKIRASDIDASFEVNYRFLYFEFKPEGKEISVGQDIYFRRRITDGRSVAVIVWVDKDKLPVSWQVLGQMDTPGPCDWGTLQAFVRAFDRAALAADAPPSLPAFRVPMPLDSKGGVG